jgi:putative transposase
MTESSPFKYFKTSPEIIRLAVMMYIRFPLSLRNVEDLLNERGIDICHETVRFWWHRFGPMFAAEIRKRRVEGLRSSHWRWHLDEVFVKINGERHYLWRAVDHESEVLESFVTKTRDKKAALKFLKKTLKRHGPAGEFVTDCLRSYGAALRELGAATRRKPVAGPTIAPRTRTYPFVDESGRCSGSGACERCRSLRPSTPVFNPFNQERSLSSRQIYKLKRIAALAEWRDLCAG